MGDASSDASILSQISESIQALDAELRNINLKVTIHVQSKLPQTARLIETQIHSNPELCYEEFKVRLHPTASQVQSQSDLYYS
jgi:hypothetical protein